jgi:hypothetical protein
MSKTRPGWVIYVGGASSRVENVTIGKEGEWSMEAMAWGMIMTGLTLFGMLALWIIGDSMNNNSTKISLREQQTLDHESAAESSEVRRAA